MAQIESRTENSLIKSFNCIQNVHEEILYAAQNVVSGDKFWFC